MVKSYNRYELKHTFGLVTSPLSNIVSVPSVGTKLSGPGNAIVGANEEVLVWDLKKGELLGRWKDSSCNSQVTCIERSKTDLDIYAIGYEDGSIRIWDSRIETVVISFNAHKSSITALSFDSTGVRLASGSRDTDIIIWDLVAEAGLVKLRGHKEQVVSLSWLYPKEDAEEKPAELENALLISASKDATVKIWNTILQHCMETHVAQTNGECWAMAINPDISGCVTAGNDGELKIWAIDSEVLLSAVQNASIDEERKILKAKGILFRENKDRTSGLIWHPTADFFAVFGNSKAVEIWRIRSETEVLKIMQRKRKRRREKEKEKEKQKGDMIMTNGHDDTLTPSITDFFTQEVVIRPTSKVTSIDWIAGRSSKNLQLLLSTSSNTLEVYKIPTKASDDDDTDYTRTSVLEVPGHRTDVRGLSLSSDGNMLASASNGSLKIWSSRTGSCLRTMDCGYALCCTFLPGDKLVLVGTKTGTLELYDIASSTLVQSLIAHEGGAIWALALHPDGRSCATGAADKSVKFWDFRLVQEDVPGTRRSTSKLNLTHSKTLKLSDDVLAITFTPDARLIAVSTLENTIKVFFTDSLKLFLNLYGHKLPALSLSVSSDSKLLVSSSADKNIRLWGLDFGDCHKALHAHNDSIMAVKFVPDPPNPQDAHLFFSASKDRTLKSWDGEKFVQVQKLPGHHGEIWAMSMSRNGEFVVTASHDKSIRVWEQVDDLVFLEEEREKEMEELYDAQADARLEADERALDAMNEHEEASAPTKQSISSLTAGEKIAEALELGLTDLQAHAEWEQATAHRLNGSTAAAPAPPRRDPQFLALNNISAPAYVLRTLAALPASHLQDALLTLPFAAVPGLLAFVQLWVRGRMNVPLAARVLFVLLRLHLRQLVASGGAEMKLRISDIRRELREAVGEMKDVMGVNVAAVRSIAGVARERGVVRVEDVDRVVGEREESRKKREFVDIA